MFGSMPPFFLPEGGRLAGAECGRRLDAAVSPSEGNIDPGRAEAAVPGRPARMARNASTADIPNSRQPLFLVTARFCHITAAMPPLRAALLAAVFCSATVSARVLAAAPRLAVRARLVAQGVSARVCVLSQAFLAPGALLPQSSRAGLPGSPARCGRAACGLRLRMQQQDEWLPAQDEASGSTYYYNPATSETRWDKPAAAAGARVCTDGRSRMYV